QLRRHQRRRRLGLQRCQFRLDFGQRQARAGSARGCGGLRGQRWPHPRRAPRSCAARPARGVRRSTRGKRHGAGAGDPGALIAPVPTMARRRAPMALVFACLLLSCWPGGAGAALQVAIDDDRLSQPEIAASQNLVDATLARLPPVWRDTPGALRLEWRDDLPDEVHGRIRGGRITLARRLLAPDADGATSDEALAALVHELAHAWDRTHGLSRDPRLLDLAGWQVRPLWPGRSRRNAFDARSPDVYELESPAEFVAVNLEHFL